MGLGFTNSVTDPCLFVKRDGDNVLIVGTYVDDIVVAHKGDGFEWFKKEFTSAFRSKHKGKLS